MRKISRIRDYTLLFIVTQKAIFQYKILYNATPFKISR